MKHNTQLYENIPIDNNIEVLLNNDVPDIPIQGEDGELSQGASGGFLQGADVGLLQGADGELRNKTYDCETDQGLPLTQKRVLLWLMTVGKNRDGNFVCFYKELGKSIGITKKAARVHVAALEKKRFIITSVLYRLGTRQPIGKRVAITKYAPPNISKIAQEA